MIEVTPLDLSEIDHLGMRIELLIKHKHTVGIFQSCLIAGHRDFATALITLFHQNEEWLVSVFTDIKHNS
jgi:hypothetical protein